MTDDLTTLGEVVTDRTLVLNVLRGLNERFTHIGALLRCAHPFPTFLQVKDNLSLEELTLGSRPPSPAAALAATTKSASQSGAGNDAGSRPNRRGKRGSGGGSGSGGNGGSGGPTQQQHTAQQQPQQAGGTKPVSLPSGGWPTVYNHWTGTIQLWSGARHPPLAPIPRPPQQQQAFVAQQQPLLQPQLQSYQLPAAPPGASEVGQWGPAGSYNPMVGRPSWDTQSLASAFSTATLNQPSSSE
jgi:hypothetical protein